MGNVIRADSIELGDKIQIDAPQVTAEQGQPKSTGCAVPQAVIVERQPEFAVVEITCSCGKKTHVKCEYGGTNPAAQNPQPANQAVPPQ